MQKVTTKAMAKVAAVATGLAMATSILSLAPMAHAAGLTQSNIDAIIGLLTSFGADASTIANVKASLTGGTPVSTGTGTSSTACSFSKDLTTGSTGTDVTCLQNGLKAGGYMSANATGYFGPATQAGVVAWQKAKGLTPAAGYFGAKSRAAWGGTSSTGSTGGVSAGTGTGLKVSLSPTSPNGTVLVQNQGIGDLGDFVFANPTSAPINVTALTFKRTGVSNDATLVNVYLYNNGTRLTDSAGVSNSSFTFADPVALFTVPAGQTFTVSVRSDIANNTSGQQIGVQLVSATSNGTLDSSVSFPISSGYQTISAANLATVSYGATVTPSSTSISPQSSFPVWQNTVSVSTNPVKLTSMRFTNLGSIDSSYVSNLRLYVDGVQAGSAVASMGSARTVTFDLSAAPVSLSTTSHTIKVLADVTGGANRTIIMSVQRSSDAMFVDSQLNQPVTPQFNGGTFSAVGGSSNTVTINYVSGTSGVSVSVDPASPNQAVAVGASSVEWARFDMLASGENVKVSDLYVFASSTASSGATAGAGGLKNGKVMVNGVQVGSTKDIGQLVAAKTDFSLGSSLILPAGQTTVVSIFADAKDTANANLATGSTVIVSLAAGSANAQGQSSLNSADVPASATSGNSISVSASTLTATKFTGYGNQTIVPGTNNAKLGAFTLSTGSTEGVTVNTIGITLTAANAASITNLTLKDDASGAVLGTVITTPAGASNQFSVNLTIPLSSSKTIDVYGNILSGSNIGSIQATVDTNTVGVGVVTGIQATANQAALQTITVGAGSLSVTRGAGDPVSNNVLAGASSVMVGEFNFAAQNSAYTVQNLAILVPNSAATSVTNVTLSYKDVNGATQTASQPLQVNALMPYATATFTGLTLYAPLNDSTNLDVYVGTPTIASGATSGAAVNVTLSTGNSNTALNNTFRAVDSSGSPLSVVNSGTAIASNGTFYVRKSIPTFAMINTNTTVPATGSPIYKFSISADPAGAIEWSRLSFNIATSSTAASSVTNVYLTDDASGASLLDSSTYASTTATKITIDLPTNNITLAKYAQVAAGATKTYDLYGTVAGFTTGSTVTISLASDGTSVANGYASGATPVAGNVVWSDRSSTNPVHSITSTDWTNGYLLKNFTANAISYSK